MDDSEIQLTKWQELSSKLFPKEEPNGDEIPVYKRIFRYQFPGFTVKSFTFFFTIFWVIWGTCVYVLYILAKSSEKEEAYSCILVKYQCGSITPYQRFEYQYWRLITSQFTPDGIITLIYGTFLLLNHGFNYESKYHLLQILVVTLGSSLLGTQLGDAFQINEVRAQGCTLLFGFLMIRLIVIFEEYQDSLCTLIFCFTTLSLKFGILIYLSAISDNGDIVSCLASGGFGVLLSLAVIKGIDVKTDACKEFIYRRLKIFLFTCCVMMLLMLMSYSFFMYDNRTAYTDLLNKYKCNSL